MHPGRELTAQGFNHKQMFVVLSRWEGYFAKQELYYDAPDGPYITRVIPSRTPQNHLWCSILPCVNEITVILFVVNSISEVYDLDFR